MDRQREFDEANKLGFPLLSDPDRRIARSFNVARRGRLPDRRHTFVIGSDSTVLRKIRSETNMNIHSDRALEVLRQVAT